MSDLSDILDDLDDLSKGADTVSAGDVIEKIGPRGQGVLLMLPGLLGVTPVGAIPTVPTLLGILTALIAVQVLIGRKYPWIPGILSDRSVEDDKIARGVERLRGPAKWIDRHFGSRLEALTGKPAEKIAALLCLAFACLLPPLEVVPFAALIPFAAIALLGLALTLRDGVLMLIAYAGSAAALWGIWAVTPWP